MTGLRRKRLAFMSIANTIKGFLRRVAGISDIVLDDCVDDASIVNYKIYGNSVQNGTPTQNSPVEVESVGEYDEETGKYKIPVICSSENGRSFTTDIYLDEPLRKVGNYRDYIDFERSVLVRNVGVDEFTEDVNYPLYNLDAYKFYGYYKTIKDMKSGTRQAGFCTHIKNTKGEKSSIWFGVSNHTIYFSLPDVYNSASTNAEKKQAIKDWLVSLEEPFLVYYPLDTQTETPIKLPKLPSIRGTCVYSTETQIQPSNIEFSYYSTSKE